MKLLVSVCVALLALCGCGSTSNIQDHHVTSAVITSLTDDSFKPVLITNGEITELPVGSYNISIVSVELEDFVTHEQDIQVIVSND